MLVESLSSVTAKIATVTAKLLTSSNPVLPLKERLSAQRQYALEHT